MSRPGSAERPLRVAIVGSGPAGFYTVQHLFQRGLTVEVDMFERLPVPFGLVRHGVAPDHAKIKNVIAVYHKLAQKPGFRFFGNVEYGRDLDLADLSELYDQVVFCTGAQTDRRLGIPGEDLPGSHPATDFVAWYNGHPDYVDYRFDLSRPAAAVIGVGNVAVDVARILCRDPDELASTDIADYALDALRRSRVRTVYLLGRRGPAQAAFTNPEAKELGELAGTETSALPAELELDPLSREVLEASPDKALRRKIDILQSFGGRRQPDRERRLILRFLVSPTEILGNDADGVTGLTLVRNRLVRGQGDRLRAEPIGDTERIDVGLVFRSVGYRGVSLPGIPFHDAWGVVPNREGRVQDPETSESLPGLYVSGWIKRGPSGVIGTNKPDALETVDRMMEDLEREIHLMPTRPSREAVDTLLRQRSVDFISYEEWMQLDAVEVARGKALGRPRVKLVRREEFASARAERSS